jgi:hypothetical protein
MKRLVLSATALCLFLLAGPAGAQTHGSLGDTGIHDRPWDVSVMGYLPWLDANGVGIGVDVRLEIPIVPDGFIPSVNDEFSLEPGLAFDYRSWPYTTSCVPGAGICSVTATTTVLDVVPQLYGVWSFWATHRFRFYVALGLGYDKAILTDSSIVGRDPSTIYVDFAAGIFYQFAPGAALRAEMGVQGLKAGVAILF